MRIISSGSDKVNAKRSDSKEVWTWVWTEKEAVGRKTRQRENTFATCKDTSKARSWSEKGNRIWW